MTHTPRTPRAQRNTRRESQPPAKLSPLQAMLCDEVADMIANGGNDSEILDLISAAYKHSVRREFSAFRVLPEEQITAAVETITSRERDKAKADLEAIWHRKTKRPIQREDTVGDTVKDRIRADVIERLRESMERFIADANPEERWVMQEILNEHNTSHRDPRDFDRLPIGEAIDVVVGRASKCWVKVPEDLRKEIDKHVKLLESAQECSSSQTREVGAACRAAEGRRAAKAGESEK